jgi:hypothetical protein
LGVLVSCPKYRGLLTRRYRLLDAMRWVQSLPIAESTELRLTFETLVFRLALNRSMHRLDQVSRSLAPEDGVGSFVEVVEQVLDLWAGVERVVAVVFQVPVAPIQRP